MRRSTRGRRLGQVLGRELLVGLHAGALVERPQAREQTPQPFGAGDRDLHRLRDLLGLWFAPEARTQRALHPDEAVDLLEHLHGDADGARLLGDAPQDGLPDPDGGVGREPQAALGLETVRGADEAEIALLDEVEHRQAAIAVAARQVHHEPEIGDDDLLAGGGIPGAGAAGEFQQFGMREQGHAPDLGQIDVQQIALGPFRQGVPLAPARGVFDIGLRQRKPGP